MASSKKDRVDCAYFDFERNLTKFFLLEVKDRLAFEEEFKALLMKHTKRTG